MDAAAANAPRTVDRPGTYEAWYVTCSDPDQGRGFWLRYTTFRPSSSSTEPAHAALWAFSFHRGEPALNACAKTVLPLGAFRSDPPFRVSIGEAVLDLSGCRGSIRNDVASARWDLRWQAEAGPFPFLAPPWERLASAANIGAQPLLRISGELEFDGRGYRLDSAPGGQQHTWGRAHALEWNWGFAAGIGTSGSGWVDGITTRVGFPLGRTVLGTSIGFDMDGRRLAVNKPAAALRAGGSISPAGWEANVGSGAQRLLVSVQPRPEDLVGVTYHDPGGGTRTCYHTELADLELRVEDRSGRLLSRFHREACAAFEYASDHPLPGLPVRL